MVKFGMSPMEAIRSATIRPAEMLDMQGEIGVIAPGRLCRHHRGAGRSAGRHHELGTRDFRDEERAGVFAMKASASTLRPSTN